MSGVKKQPVPLPSFQKNQLPAGEQAPSYSCLRLHCRVCTWCPEYPQNKANKFAESSENVSPWQGKPVTTCLQPVFPASFPWRSYPPLPLCFIMHLLPGSLSPSPSTSCVLSPLCSHYLLFPDCPSRLRCLLNSYTSFKTQSKLTSSKRFSKIIP